MLSDAEKNLIGITVKNIIDDCRQEILKKECVMDRIIGTEYIIKAIEQLPENHSTRKDLPLLKEIKENLFRTSIISDKAFRISSVVVDTETKKKDTKKKVTTTITTEKKDELVKDDAEKYTKRLKRCKQVIKKIPEISLTKEQEEKIKKLDEYFRCMRE